MKAFVVLGLVLFAGVQVEARWRQFDFTTTTTGSSSTQPITTTKTVQFTTDYNQPGSGTLVTNKVDTSNFAIGGAESSTTSKVVGIGSANVASNLISNAYGQGGSVKATGNNCATSGTGSSAAMTSTTARNTNGGATAISKSIAGGGCP